MIERSRSMKTQEFIDCKTCLPRQYSLFCDLKNTELNYLNKYKLTKTYKKHEILFREGEKPQYLFCCFSDLVKIYKSMKSGREQVVRLSHGGDLIGYRAFFSGESYSASSECVSESTVCSLSREGFNELVKNSPHVAMDFLKKISIELREAEEKFSDLIEKTVEERLAYFLALFMKRSHAHCFELPLSREEIASLIGARPETVIRVFSSWRKMGYLEVKAKSIKVLDSSFLQH